MVVEIRDRLREYRRRSGLSQSKIAEIAGVNLRMYQYYEQGAKDLTKAEAGSVLRIAKALGVTVEDLIG